MRNDLAFAGLTLLLGLGGAFYFSGASDSLVAGLEHQAALPACDSSHGVDDAKKAIENSPAAKSSSLTVVALTDAKSLFVSDSKVECTGVVILNSARRGTINYSFTKDPSLAAGTYLINAALDLPSFKPYP
ncbi:hypothetical protein [Bradyrhizobium sp. ORS 86]|uniref:hypothetical protein n=1 Tax=Bradyrhizobium sp. ORS 86 TaxID=1685970 RepID=UPI00389025F7